MNELQKEYEKSHAKAIENIDRQLGLFNELDGRAKTSIDNLIRTLKGQIDYMETYAENIQWAMEMGVDEGLIRKLSDGSEESAQILSATVQGGEEAIAALKEQLAKMEERKENFSVAEIEMDFSERMKEIARNMEDTIDEMELADEMDQIGEHNIQGLINSTASMTLQLTAEYREMGRAAAEAYRREVEQTSPSKNL